VQKDSYKYTSLRVNDNDTLFERKNREANGNLKIKIEANELDKFFGSSG